LNQVSGRVLDATTGEPLPGATVMINGSTIGTVTEQTKSKAYRAFERAFKTDKLHEQLYQKYSKRNYAGKPTKRYIVTTHVPKKV
jgi:hypothetical protein